MPKLLGLVGLGLVFAWGMGQPADLTPDPGPVQEEADEGSGHLISARARVALPPTQTPAVVNLEYRVRPDSGTHALPLTLLLMGPGRHSAPRAFVDGSPVPLALSEVREGYLVGELPLPLQGSVPQPLSVSLEYEVESAWEGEERLVLPLLVPAWVPEDAGPRTFLAEVEIPPGVTLLGSFPTSVLEMPKAGEGGLVRIGLQAMPSALVLSVSRSDPGWLSLERSLDLLVILALLLMGIAGWRHVRRQR